MGRPITADRLGTDLIPEYPLLPFTVSGTVLDGLLPALESIPGEAFAHESGIPCLGRVSFPTYLASRFYPG